jgi:carboxyl-terminal processing protease
VTTDDGGTFEISSLTPGRYRVRIEHADYLPRSVEARARDRDDRVDLGEIRLGPAASAAGEVVDALGEPVPGATVGGPRGAPSAVTDSEGRFVLRGLPPETTTLRVRHGVAGQAESPPLALQPGERVEGVRVRLPGRLGDPSASEAGAEPSPAQTGLALEVETRDGGVVVTTVLPGSSAARAGLRAGDRIVAVDDHPVQFAGEARSAFRGPAGVPALVEARRGRRTLRLRIPREIYRP